MLSSAHNTISLIELVSIGNGVISMRIESVAVHAPACPLTTYVVLLTGLAVTDAPLVEESPSAGFQVYWLAPLALSVIDDPAHMLVSLLRANVICGSTVKMVVMLESQPNCVVNEVM